MPASSVPSSGLEVLALSLLDPSWDAASRLQDEADVFFPDEDDKARRRDFDRLFLIPSPGRILPLESCYRARWRSPDGQVHWERPDPDVLWRVRDLYRRFEFHIPERWAHQPDHAGVELMFLHGLRVQEAAARKAGQRDLADRLVLWQKEFRNQHLQGWIPDLADDLVREARTSFYREVGRLLAEAFSRESGD